MPIKCCKGCVAPKRYPGCHDRCAEYLTEKAQYETLKEVEQKRKRTDAEIISSRTNAVAKALKSRRYSQKNYRSGSKSAQ